MFTNTMLLGILFGNCIFCTVVFGGAFAVVIESKVSEVFLILHKCDCREWIHILTFIRPRTNTGIEQYLEILG